MLKWQLSHLNGHNLTTAKFKTLSCIYNSVYYCYYYHCCYCYWCL